MEKSVLITGVLGGLGASLAKEMLSRDWQVAGLDNFDPGCGSTAHQKYICDALCEHENFRLIEGDVRSFDYAEMDAIPELTLHCAALTPLRRGTTTEETIREISLEAPLRLIDAASAASKRSLLLHHDLQTEKDLRLRDPLWLALFRAEESLRRQIVAKHCQVIILPALIGKGQSLNTPPARQFLQSISRIPVQMDEGENVQTFALPLLINWILALIESENIPEDIPFILPDLPVRSVSLVELVMHLCSRCEIVPEKMTEGFPAWGPESAPALPDETLVNELDELLAWLQSLPHVPPANWPDVPKIEARERRKRRRRRSKRKNTDNGTSSS